ncbi:MAG: glycosyltransferase family 29 protein [Pseudomonadales bacterium]
MVRALSYIVGERNGRPLQLDGSVAMVGNSDALLGKGLGAEIDQFDHVFRFNLCDLDAKYRGDTGSKVDYCFFSLNISTRKYPHPPEEQARFVSLCKKAKIICYPKNAKHVRKFNKSPLAMTAQIDDINRIFYLHTAPERVAFSTSNHPRNGIKLLACLVDADIRPVLFGFDSEDRGDNKHYFDDETQVEATAGGHKPSWEYRLLDMLEKRGLIGRR